MLSIDKSIEKTGTSVRGRMEHYGSLVEGIDIILLGATTQYPIMLQNGVVVHPIVSRSKLISVCKAIFVARRLAKKTSIVTVQDPFELGLIGFIISCLTFVPLSVQVHIDFFSPYFKGESIRQNIQARIAPFVLRRATSIRVVSQKIATYIHDTIGIDAKKIVIAPVFVDASKTKMVSVSTDLHKQYPEFEWIVLVASRFVPQKNIPLAIEAFDEFRKQHQKVGMIIIGSGPSESVIQRCITDRNLGSVVKVDSSLSTQFISCMKTSDVFVLSSDYEGWGMTIIEVASVGTPVIMTRVGCADEFIVHEKNGLIVPVRDRGALTAALEKYYSDRSFASRIRERAAADAQTYMTLGESDLLQKKVWEYDAQNI